MVTLLFTDIEGSTRLLQQLGERYPETLAAHQRVLRSVFQAWNGYEVDTQGDSFFVTFARATDALAAAVAAQQALAAHPWPEGAAVRVRMGLHTGAPACTGETYVGLDVHRAARVSAAGHGGQVLLSQATAVLVERELPEGVTLRQLGPQRLKDLLHAEQLFQLVIAGLPDSFPPLKTLDARPTNLPIQATALIGREREIVAVGELLRRDEVRLLTLTGPGGTGKTRLAIQVAANLQDVFANGVWFVDLAPIADPQLVAHEVARALGLPEARGVAPEEQLRAYLRDEHLLLLLDNFEQVLIAAPLVSELLRTAPELVILVTSRAALHISAEHEYPIDPLGLPDIASLSASAEDVVRAVAHSDAVRLFVARAQAVKPDFGLTEANAAAIATICTRLDGLPLAIELAAARVKLFPPQALLAHLSSSGGLATLTSGARDLPARQQTIRDTIAWSYQLLSADEQTLFARLGVFVGGFTLDAVQAVCAESSMKDVEGRQTSIDDTFPHASFSVLPSFAALVDHSLVRLLPGEEAMPRYGMLETVREFARERLSARGEFQSLQRRHAEYFLALAERAEPELLGREQVKWLDYFDQEIDNLRAGRDWAIGAQAYDTAARLGAALVIFWDLRDRLDEGEICLQSVVSASDKLPTATYAKALRARANLFWDEFEPALPLFERSLAIYGELGDRHGAMRVLIDMGWTLAVAVLSRLLDTREVAVRQIDPSKVEQLLHKGLIGAREYGDRPAIAKALHGLGWLEFCGGSFAQARAYLEQSLAIRKDIGDHHGIAWSALMLSRVACAEGDYDIAYSLMEQRLAAERALGHQQGVAISLHALAILALEQANLVRAETLLNESEATFRGFGNRLAVAIQTNAVRARIMLLQGQYAQAVAQAEEILATAREFGESPEIIVGLTLEAAAALAQGNHTQARQHLEESKALSYQIGDQLSVALSLHLLGQVALREGELALAHSLLQESLAAYRTQAIALPCAQVTSDLGYVALGAGDLDEARASLAESLQMLSRIGARLDIARTIEGFAALAEVEQRAELAARLWGAAEALREQLGTPIWPVDVPDYERRVSAARVQLDETAFAAAWAAGRARTMEQMITAALNG
jgi:predicted ATPase/class 3 adenylate cyclase